MGTDYSRSIIKFIIIFGSAREVVEHCLDVIAAPTRPAQPDPHK